MNHLWNVSRTTCCKRVPQIGLGGHREPIRLPPCHHLDLFLASNLHTANFWYFQEPFALSWVTPIDHRIRWLSHGVAPIIKKSLEEGEKRNIMERRRNVAAVQRALMDYLHVTRGISFIDAEHMSKHSPAFLSKLLEKVKEEKEEDRTSKSKARERVLEAQRISKALVRFFNYNPINEFEPFFESIGLKPSEYDALLPQNLMFLADDEMLLENHHVLCNYGIDRSKIGRIYRDVTEVFGYGWGVLASKLHALEELGFSKTNVIKLVTSSPAVLIGGPNSEFLKILQWLDDVGIQRAWIGEFLSTRKAYNWGKMLEVLLFFSELGFTKEGIGNLIRQHPDFLLDGSGRMLFTVVLIMLKAGAGKKELFDLFVEFPNVPAGNFARNLQRGILFLAEIDISDEDIQKFVVSYPSVLGSAPLKKPNSILTCLNVGKKRLCKIIMEEPHRLMKYTLGSKLNRLPKSDAEEISLKEKVKFLTGIGFVEGSDHMKEALKNFRGKGAELQDRYDFLVKTGFDPKDVVNMIKIAPQVLNQKINVLESKIFFLVNNIGYPLSALVAFPAYMSFTIERTKLRFLMYNWLQEKGLVKPGLALSSVLACSDKYFVKHFVEKHPKGLEVWENHKRELVQAKNMSCS